MCDKSNKNTLQHILHEEEAPRGDELTDICGTLQLELLRTLTT